MLTEDSDILVYSAISGKPFNVFYKFEKSGAVQILNLAHVGLLTAPVAAVSQDGTGTGTGGGGGGGGSQKGKGSEKEKEKEKDKEKGFLAMLKRFHTLTAATTASATATSSSAAGGGSGKFSRPTPPQPSSSSSSSSSSCGSPLSSTCTPQRMFVQMCILSGCDYCDNINSIGIMTAQQV